MKRLSLAVMLAIPALGLVGCSDYPSDGVVDTRQIRERAVIEEISGAVYGLKKGSTEAAQSMEADKSMTYQFSNAVWDHVARDGDKPDFTLSYDGVDTSAMEEEAEKLFEAAQAHLDEKMADHEADIQEIRDQKAKYESQLAEFNTAKASYEAHMKTSADALKEANEELQDAISRYNGVLNGSVSQLSELASKHGLVTFTGNSPLASYQYTDYTNRNSKPVDCPTQKGRATLDTRAKDNRCLYIMVPRQFLGTKAEAEARQILVGSMSELIVAAEKLGNKGGWMSKKTGLYLAADNAEKAVNAARREAVSKFGDSRRREYNISQLTRAIEQADHNIESMSSDEYINSRVTAGLFSVPESYMSARRDYLKSLAVHFKDNHAEKVSDITMDKVDGKPTGVFKDVGSGYVSLVAVTDLLISDRGHRGVLRSVEMLDLTSEAVADADQLEITINARNVDRRHGDDRGEEEMFEEALDYFVKRA